MSNERAFRGVWIPASIWLDERLSLQEKVMLIEIDSLQHPERGCFKTNKGLAKFFGLTAGRVSQIVKSLQEKGFVRVEQIRQGKQIIERRIYMNAALETAPEGSKNPKEGYLENAANPSKNPKEGYLENAEERGSGLGVQYEGKTPTVASDDATAVFEHWRSVMGKSKRTVLDNNRKRLIKKALSSYSLNDVKAAITGCSLSPHHMGRNDRNTVYNGLDLILRNAEKIEQFIGYSENPPANIHSLDSQRQSSNAPAPNSDDCGGKVYIPAPANGGGA